MKDNHKCMHGVPGVEVGTSGFGSRAGFGPEVS